MALREKKSSQAGSATRAHIMDVAEVLFAENGPGNVSVRDIADRANVNLGAVNYHFVTKENLFKEVFERAIVPLNSERLALLEQALVAKDNRLRAVISAFVAPLFRLATGPQERARLLVVTRYLHEAFASPEGGRAVISDFYEPIRNAFIEALQSCVPSLSAAEVCWRYDSMVGVSLYALGGLERMSGASVTQKVPDVATALEWAVAFLEAGFRAAPSGAKV